MTTANGHNSLDKKHLIGVMRKKKWVHYISKTFFFFSILPMSVAFTMLKENISSKYHILQYVNAK